MALSCVSNQYYHCLPGYVVEMLPVHGRGDWRPVNALNPSKSPNYTVTGLPGGAEYEFRVVAVNDAGPGKPSKSTGPHKVRDPVCEYT